VDEQLLAGLAGGTSVAALARQIGVSERTIHRRLETKEFRDRLHRLRGQILETAGGFLASAALESAQTLVALQGEEHPPAVRLGAARTVLEQAVRVRELIALETRVDQLQQDIERLEASRG
jgi:AcrR family transcriptional regulator